MKFPRSLCIYLLTLTALLGCSEDTEPENLASTQLLDQAYGSHDLQTMDVFLPAGRSPGETPLLVYIHGGAWIDGDKSEIQQVQPLLESEFPGYALISLNYRLFDFATQTNGIADQEQDVIAAFDYIDSKLGEWHISDDIVVAGASAGGHLALLHAYKNNSSDLKAAIAFFPPSDLTELYGANDLTASILALLLGGTPTTAAAAYTDASPVRFVDKLDVPTIFFHGDLDPIVPISQSILLEEALDAAGVRHQFKVVSGQGHGFTAITYMGLLREAKDFIGNF